MHKRNEDDEEKTTEVTLCLMEGFGCDTKSVIFQQNTAGNYFTKRKSMSGRAIARDSLQSPIPPAGNLQFWQSCNS